MKKILIASLISIFVCNQSNAQDDIYNEPAHPIVHVYTTNDYNSSNYNNNQTMSPGGYSSRLNRMYSPYNSYSSSIYMSPYMNSMMSPYNMYGSMISPYSYGIMPSYGYNPYMYGSSGFNISIGSYYPNGCGSMYSSMYNPYYSSYYYNPYMASYGVMSPYYGNGCNTVSRGPSVTLPSRNNLPRNNPGYNPINNTSFNRPAPAYNNNNSGSYSNNNSGFSNRSSSNNASFGNSRGGGNSGGGGNGGGGNGGGGRSAGGGHGRGGF